MKLPAQDKLAHFAVGMMLVLFLALLFPLQYAVIGAVLVGGGKEVYDYFNRDRHTPDVWDFLWTVAGIAYAALVLWLMLKELRVPPIRFLTDPAATSYAESIWR